MGLLTPLAVRIGALSWMPKLLPQVVWTDKHLQRLTRGRVTLLDIAGLPNLLLTVPGRKSGVPRIDPAAVRAARRWLADRGLLLRRLGVPLWVANLRATDRARIRFRREEVEVTRREVEGEERARLWQVMLATWPNFARYEQRTTRMIPVFYLERAPA